MAMQCRDTHSTGLLIVHPVAISSWTMALTGGLHSCPPREVLEEIQIGPKNGSTSRTQSTATTDTWNLERSLLHSMCNPAVIARARLGACPSASDEPVLMNGGESDHP